MGNLKEIVENLIDNFLEAGDLAIQLREKGLIKKIKSDNTPVSNGDLEVNKFISKKISEVTPNLPIISEIFFVINLLTSKSPLLTGVLSDLISFFNPFSLRDSDKSPAFKKVSIKPSIIFFVSILISQFFLIQYFLH